MAAAYVGLGSNRGDRIFYLKKSLELLEQEPAVKITAVSPLYETEPVGGPPQGLFFNACACAETMLRPTALLARLLEIEDGLGRERRARWGPRTVDLDLLLYGAVIMRTPLLHLPHPRLAERDFVLIPLSRIAPDLLVPGTGKTVRQLLRDLPPGPAVTLFQEYWR
jgi:2-amino-4-hydroxy-6-hydroxymethyldihydropteridine diphosphokinase